MTPLLVLAEFRCSEEGDAELCRHVERTLQEARGVEGCLEASVWERRSERRYLFTTVWSDRDALRRWVENEFHRTVLMPGFRRWCTEGSFGEFSLETDHDRARRCRACGRWTRARPGWSEQGPRACRQCGGELAFDRRSLGASTSAPPAPAHGAVWGRAFRPFFLAAALFGAQAAPWWALAWLGATATPDWLVPMWWHGHEMVFGLVAAAIAGFLLTASPVWTGGPALTGRPLAALVALWAAGRVAMAAAGILPRGLVAGLDLAFLPAVSIAVLRTLRGSGQHRNYAVAALVLVLALANAAMHAEALGFVSGLAGRALRFAVDVVVVLLLVIGGRITPAFTQNALRRRGSEAEVRSWPWLSAATVGAAGALALTSLLFGRGTEAGVVAAIAGLAAAARLAGWRSWETRSDPLLWSLHAGAAWAAAGLLLAAASDLGAPIPPAAGLHALTAGAIATTILAVMTRVGLGHTGRPLVVPGGVVACYALAHAAAGLRVASTFAGNHPALLVASSLAWSAAFGIFAIRYWTILTTPRPDGRPG